MLRSLCMIVSDQFEENSLFVEESVETSVKILLNRCFVRCILVTDACADRGRARHDAALALYGDYMYELMTTQQVEEDLQAAKPFTIATSSMVLERSLNSVQDYIVETKKAVEEEDSMSTRSGRTGSVSSIEEEEIHDHDTTDKTVLHILG